MNETLEALVLAYASVRSLLSEATAERDAFGRLLDQYRHNLETQQREIEALRKKIDNAEQHAARSAIVPDPPSAFRTYKTEAR